MTRVSTWTTTETQNQPIWIDVTVPAGTPAGTYRGTITVTTDQGSLVLPLELKVWSFTLPAQPTLSINFTLDPAWTLPPQYDVSQGTPAFYDLVDKHYEALVAHRLSPMNLYRAPAVSETSGQVQLDWSQADPLYAHWLDAHDLPAFYIPDVYDGDNDRYRIRGDNSHYYTQAAFGDPTFVAKAKQYYAAVRDHLVNRGWWDQAWTYPTDETEWVADEPLNNGLDGYQRLAAWAQLLKDPDLDYRIMASSVYPIPVGPSDPDHGWPDLKGLVDDWNVVVQDADRDPELWESRQALGETLSFYHNDWGDFLDYKATLHRGLGWVAYKYGAWAVTGWAVAAWIGSADSIVNPWQSAVTPVYGYGGGALFWPGHAIEGDANKNVDGPLPSIRLKLAREAVEDHDYLTSLAAQTSPEYARALVRGLIPRDYRDWDPSPEAIYALRDRIGRLLDSGASIPLATIHGQVTDEATTQPIPGVFVTDGASGALADAAGQYTLTVTVPASGSVTLNFSAPRYQPATHSVIVSVPAQSAGRSLTASQASTPPSHPAQKGVGPTLRSPIGQIQAAGLGKLSPEVHLRANPAGGISAPRYQPATQSVTVSVPAQTAGRSLTASQASTPPSRPAQKGAGQIQAAGLGKLSPEVHLRANSASDQATLDATLTRVVEESLLLYSFETDAEVNEWEFANTQSVARATSRVTAGAYALRVVFGDGVGQGEPYAGVGTFPTRDWSGYTALEFDVYNESDYYTDLDVYIVDAVGGEYPRTGGTITLLPNRSRHVVIPMQEVAASGVDLTSIDWLDIDPTTMIQVENYKGQRVKRWPAGPRTLYFDNLRLVRVVVE